MGVGEGVGEGDGDGSGGPNHGRLHPESGAIAAAIAKNRTARKSIARIVALPRPDFNRYFLAKEIKVKMRPSPLKIAMAITCGSARLIITFGIN